jgi:hypothetical protein
MRWLTVKNWQEFQHYKDRNPPWIKLHRTILDDYEFASLPDRSKAHLMLIWVFASQNDGRIPNDAAFLARKLGLEAKPDLDELISHGFLIPEQDASGAQAPSKQDAPLVRDTTATQKLKRQTGRAIPEDFKITDEIRAWAASKGYDNIEASLDYMRDWAASGGHLRADWVATLRNCIKGDWGKARENARKNPKGQTFAPPSHKCVKCGDPCGNTFQHKGGIYCLKHHSELKQAERDIELAAKRAA